MTNILGIDRGLDGAVAVLDESGNLLRIEDMPTLEDGAKGRRALNAPLLAAIIYSTHASRAYCELVGPRPTDGKRSRVRLRALARDYRGRLRRGGPSRDDDRAPDMEARVKHRPR